MQREGSLMVFLQLHLEPRVHSRVTAGMDIQNSCSFRRHQDSCLVMRDTSGISSRLGSATRTLLNVKRDTQCPFLIATVILGFLSIFNKSQASSPFEALNSACLSRCQRDVRPPVQMRRGPRVSLRSPQEIQTSLHLVG